MSAKQEGVSHEIFKLNFVHDFIFWSFLELIKHDFMRVWKFKTGNNRFEQLDKHPTIKPVMVSCE